MASKRASVLVSRLLNAPPRINTTTNFSLTRSRISHSSSSCTSTILHEDNHETPAKKSPDLRQYATVAASHLCLMPTGDVNLLEKLREIGIVKERIRLDGLMMPPSSSPEKAVAAKDVKKILRAFQLEKVKKRLRLIGKDCIEYKEFLEICAGECSSFDQVVDFAKALDDSGNVIILGNNVYLNQEKVFKDTQSLIPTRVDPYDPRMKEYQEMEIKKLEIDRKAKASVQRELSYGLAFLVVQTTGFMRLTFWELTWDVMEPICFFVTSFYIICGYAFFLKTMKEPTFEGFYQSRFEAKQKRIMKTWKFDLERYNELKKACVSPYS